MRSLRRRFRRNRTPISPRRAVVQFALSGLVSLIVVGVLASLVLRGEGTKEAVRDARRLTLVLARSVVEPNLGDELLSGDPTAIARLDRTLRTRVIGDAIVRVKIWSSAGRIVYSDDPRQIGSRYGLAKEEREVLERGGAHAEVSDLSKPENRFERGRGKLLEVYTPVRTPSGESLLFETYQRFSSIAAGGRETWLAFAPAALAALLLLWLVQLPLALSLARRVRDGLRERESLLRRAIEASEAERRRIAGDLHDGVVQELAGVSYSLAATADRLPRDGDGVAGTLRAASAATRQSMRSLRSLIVEIYPPNLASVGLSAAVADLAAPLTTKGIDVQLETSEDLSWPPAVEALLFRAAQEALRNVASHAQARSVTVRLEAGPAGTAALLVADDGLGFSPEKLALRRNGGHLGLQLLDDLAGDAGGTLEVRSASGRGTTFRMEVPIR